MKRIMLVIMLVALEASAGPYKETLAKPDIEAIVKAIQAALPKVDQAAVKQCQPALDAYNKDPEGSTDKLGPGAACFRAAGSIGTAIDPDTLCDHLRPIAMPAKAP